MELAEEEGNNLKKKGIKLMTTLQEVNKEKRKNDEAQDKVQADLDTARRRSTGSQEDVNHLTKKLNSAQKAKRTLTSGRMQIVEPQAEANVSGKEWMTSDVT